MATEAHDEDQPGTAAGQAAPELESQFDKAQDAVNELQKHLTALRLFQQHDGKVLSAKSQSQGLPSYEDKCREATKLVVDHMLELVSALDTSLKDAHAKG